MVISVEHCPSAPDLGVAMGPRGSRVAVTLLALQGVLMITGKASDIFSLFSGHEGSFKPIQQYSFLFFSVYFPDGGCQI